MNSIMKRKKGLNIVFSIGLGLAVISIAGLIVIYVFINTVVHSVVYGNTIEIAQANKLLHAASIDNWLSSTSQTVAIMSTVMHEVSDEYEVLAIAQSFSEQYDFIYTIFIAYADGRFIDAEDINLPDDWIVSERPWYIASRAAPFGQIVVTEPYISPTGDYIVMTMAIYLPDFGGIGAVIGTVILLDSVLDTVNQYALVEDGFAILLATDGRIIAHPHPDFGPYMTADEETGEKILVIRNAVEVVGIGGYLMEVMRAGTRSIRFESVLLGDAYFLAQPLGSLDLTLVSLVPFSVIQEPVDRYMRTILIPLVTVLMVLLTVVIAFVLTLVRRMEKSEEAEDRLNLIFESIPMAVTLRDTKSNILYCNSEVLNLYGLNSLEEFPDKFNELSPEFQPDGESSVTKGMEITKRAFAEGKQRVEWMHKRLDGELLPTEVSLVPVNMRGEDYMIAFIRDLREFYALRKKEREASDRIKLMFDATPLVIHYWDRNARIIDCNENAKNYYGFATKDEYIKFQMGRRENLQPENKQIVDGFIDFLMRVFETGYAKYDFADRTKEGRLAFAEMVGIRMTYNDEAVVVTYGTDVTELRQVLTDMREAEERLQLMLDGTPVACYLINSDFEAIDCNMETLSLFGFSSKADGIKMFKDVLPHTEFFQEQFAITIETGGCRFEYDLTKISGESIPCDISLVRFSHKGENVIAAYVFDLSALKEVIKGRERLELAEEHNRAKDRFIARVSHELRTPISAIMGISEIELQQPDLFLRVEESFAKIHDSANILLGIVNDILDLSKIEAGKMAVVKEVYEISSLVNDVSQLHIVYQDSNAVELIMSIDENLPTRFIGDSVRIKQIMNNLLSNAFKYTTKGSVKVSLSFEKAGTDSVILIITIEDTGLGMTKEQLESLHMEFYRFHEDKSTASGIGLGMPIVYSLIQMMDAAMNIESCPNVGTKVTVRIPQTIVDSETLGKAAVESLQKFEMSKYTAAKRFNFEPEQMPYGRVLVVDDVDANLYVAQGLLKFYGLNIETCNSGRQAIEKIEAGNVYDIIFMDHTMPDLSGTEVTRILRGKGYNHPIIVFTANALIGHSEEFIKNGFDGFISKPINTNHLNAVLVKYIKNSPKNKYNVNKPANVPNDINGFLSDPELVNKLRADFAKTQKDTVADIRRAINDGDIKTSHRLAHNLKGLAGLIHENTLAEYSRVLEVMLRDGKFPEEGIPESALYNIESELTRVLAAIAPEEEVPQEARVLDKERAIQVFEKLEPLLEDYNAEACSMTTELKTIPETDKLIEQIENFEFAEALEALEDARSILGI